MDSFNCVSTANACRAAFGSLDGIQSLKEGQQLAGVSLMFLLLCKRLNVNPRDTLAASERIIQDGLKENNEHINAIFHYLRMELPTESKPIYF
jgi:hypothetical protein